MGWSADASSETFTETFTAISTALTLRVVDGDTIKVNGEYVRLVGFDTPETQVGQFHCPAERALGKRATARVNELIRQGPVEVTYDQDRRGLPKRDLHGRLLGHLLVGGREVGAILIAEGLAVPYTGRVSRVRNHSWCGV
jgi:endonuclease YncB( thermonuclease family)